jgi:membrane protease YdiL (CAAX protease family)
MVVHFLHNAMFSPAVTNPQTIHLLAHPSIMAIPFSLLNPFFEELIVRAYVMAEVFDLTGSLALAVILSVVVQVSYHLYYGWVGAIALSFQFALFALYYAHSRRILPVIVAHGFFDIYALLRLW